MIMKVTEEGTTQSTLYDGFVSENN